MDMMGIEIRKEQLMIEVSETKAVKEVVLTGWIGLSRQTENQGYYRQANVQINLCHMHVCLSHSLKHPFEPVRAYMCVIDWMICIKL